MRLHQTERMRGLIRRLPRGGPLAWTELALIVVLGVQLARLVWAVATPVGSYGEWRPRAPATLSAAQRQALFAGFDPFFRGAAAGGPQAVTSLALTLFGTSINEASGRGGAIIATPDGVQQSFGVGDEVVPGVTLKQVALDHVVLSRGGRDESLFLDQSQPAVVAGAGPGLILPVPAPPATILTPAPPPVAAPPVPAPVAQPVPAPQVTQ